MESDMKKKTFPITVPSLSPHCLAAVCLALACCAAPGLRADVTIRYETSWKPAADLPPAFAQLVKAAAQNAGTPTVIRMKGHEGYSAAGDVISIIDFETKDLTLVDASHKTFAKLPVSELADRIAAAMPAEQMKTAQQAMASIKTKVDSKITGRTAVIQSVQAEEREITISIDMPVPSNVTQPSPTIRLVMQIWTALPGEALRVPAIRELTGFNLWQKYFLNPATTFEKIAGKIPAAAETVTPIFEELSKNQSVILRMHMDMYMPSIAALAQQVAGQTGGSAGALDANAPIMEMNQEVVELSNAPVDASLFEIPKEYSAAPADDLIRGMFFNKTRKSAGEIASQAVTAQAAPPADGGVYKVGSGVSPPRVIYKQDPLYSEEARKAHLAGTVVLQVVVGTDGLAGTIRVVRALGMGLDERAIEAVTAWRFQPGTKDGSPVAILATIEVNFRLLPDGNKIPPEPDRTVWRISRLVFEPGGSSRPVLTKWHLPDGPAPNGDLRISFKLNVDKSGHVIDTSAEGAADPALAAALQEAVRKWKFDVPDGSNATSYAATLDLSYGDSAPARTPPSRAAEVRAEPKNAEEA
jgi:TonB family protein